MDYTTHKTPYLQKWEQEQLGTISECIEDSNINNNHIANNNNTIITKKKR